MAVTKLVLDRQAVAQTFDFGTTSASGEGLVTINKGTAAASTVVLDVKGSATVGGSLNLTGDLNVTGSINQTTVTELNVTDKVVRVNNGGTTAGAANSGLIVEGDSDTPLSGIVYNTTGSKWFIGSGVYAGGAFPTQAEIVDASTAQTLSSKTFTGTTNFAAISASGTIAGNLFSGSGASLTTLNGSNIASGTVPSAYGGAGTVNGIMKANGSGVVSAATSGTDYVPPSGTGATGTWGISITGNAATATAAGTAEYLVDPGSGADISYAGTQWQVSATGGLYITGLTQTDALKVATGAGASKILSSDADGDLTYSHTIQTTLTDSDAHIPTSGAIVDYVVAAGTHRQFKRWTGGGTHYSVTTGAGNGTATGARIEFVSGRDLVDGTEQVFRNGQLLNPGSADYTFTANGATGGGTLLAFNTGFTLAADDVVTVYAESTT